MTKPTPSGVPESPNAALRSARLDTALGVLFDHDEISRTELAELTGYSRPSVTSTVRDLLAVGLVRETGRRESTGGRRRTLLQLDRDALHLSMVSTEPSELVFRQLDLSGRQSVEVRRPLTTDSAVDQVEEGVAELHQRAPHQSRCAIVALPGVVSSDDTVSNSPFLPVERTTRLRSALEARLNLPVIIENDVNLLALGESTQGCARGHDDFALIYVGEGIGAAIVSGGRPYLGATGSAGEIGFLPWGLHQPSGEGIGPLEAAWSNRSLADKAHALGVMPQPGSLTHALASSPSPAAWELLTGALDAWSYAATVVACVVNPSMVVFAGLAADLPPEAAALLEAKVAASVPTQVEVSFAQLGLDALAAGAIARVKASPQVLLDARIPSPG